MLRFWLLRFHRWIALVLSIPFAVVIVTGLVLSFEPMVMGAGSPAVTTASINAALTKHDPDGKARSIAIRAYDSTLSIGGAQRSQATIIDLASNERAAAPGMLASLFGSSRRLHENFIYDLRWVVTASTIAMLVMILLGILMGWPRIRNTVSGWHKGAGWFALPLVILSPLTGLALAFGITFATPAARPAGPAPSLSEALGIVGTQYDLSRITWVRPLGGVLAARINDNGEMRVFAVTRDGLVPFARNWPRLIHEGNWSGIVAPLLNVITSIALTILMVTGLWIWGRRQFRQRQPRERCVQIVGSTENA
ncbi:PepSY-associated TM helix domain-containing protein [Undibacter mobilis]|uniref:PepSY domain-containing protein n=1 Tax=Undibacter mobilis TaxID=2292256 RepID=A0A371BD42_9BRAD|nr:PepSY-associated TM helix domain-containing protein [Undibacter mobilis]RDV05470.1 PepSY domain-containing protein [Undibacter mobilis]